MELSEQQRQAVRDWVAAGASLSDVQRNLKNEFGVVMTYMDVRLLVLDLGASVKDKPDPKPVRQEPEETPADPAVPGNDPYAEEALDAEDAPGTGADDPYADEPLPEGAGGAAAKVSLSLDRLVVPGAMVSGTVTFSDGIKARWMIDQMGRFGLDADKPGYRPSNADLQAFQMQLRTELRRHGYA